MATAQLRWGSRPHYRIIFRAVIVLPITLTPDTTRNLKLGAEAENQTRVRRLRIDCSVTELSQHGADCGLCTHGLILGKDALYS